jgi:hypothetical protein
MLILLGFSCNKKTQKTQEPKTQVQEERDTPQNQEIHAPKSDDKIEINKKKQEQTEKQPLLRSGRAPPYRIVTGPFEKSIQHVPV